MEVPSGLKKHRKVYTAHRGVLSSASVYLAIQGNWIHFRRSGLITGGVWNGSNNHWCVMIGSNTYAFVWNCDTQTLSTRYILGAKCMGEGNGAARGHSEKKLLGETTLDTDDIYGAASFVCSYFGCHHVLTRFPGDFLRCFIYLILDNPSGISGITVDEAIVSLLDGVISKNVICYDPSSLVGTSQRALQGLPISSGTCRISSFLEEHDMKHGELEVTDNELNSCLENYEKDVRKEVEEYPYLSSICRVS